MALDADIQALAAKFEKIECMVAELFPKGLSGLFVDPMDEIMEQNSGRPSRVKSLVSSYDNARVQFLNIAPQAKITPDYIGCQVGLKVPEYVDILDRLKINCATAVAFLQALASRIPPIERDKLNSMRDQMTPLENYNPHLFKHLMLAVDEYENGHFPASALLAGKSVVYVLNCLQGATDEEKVDYLVKSGLLEEKLKDKSLKAARKARNYFSHDISAFAEPSDALNSISEAVDLSLKWKSTVKS
jgi:hypothetical protein